MKVCYCCKITNSSAVNTEDLNMWKRENTTLQTLNIIYEDKMKAETAMRIIPVVTGKQCELPQLVELSLQVKEAYLEPHQTSMKEPFYENIQQPLPSPPLHVQS